MYAPPLRYKREALAAHSRLEEGQGKADPGWTLTQHRLGFTPNNPVLNLLRAQAIQHTVDVALLHKWLVVPVANPPFVPVLEPGQGFRDKSLEAFVPSGRTGTKVA